MKILKKLRFYFEVFKRLIFRQTEKDAIEFHQMTSELFQIDNLNDILGIEEPFFQRKVGDFEDCYTAGDIVYVASSGEIEQAMIKHFEKCPDCLSALCDTLGEEIIIAKSKEYKADSSCDELKSPKGRKNIIKMILEKLEMGKEKDWEDELEAVLN